MCLMIVSPTGKRIPKDVIIKGWQGNPHGGGVAWLNHHVIVSKGHMTLTALLAAYDQVPENAPHILHVRFGTHGGTVPHLTHPFKCGKGGWLAHNGILRGEIDFAGPAESDTSAYCDKVLAKMPYHWWEFPALCKLVAREIGSYNKFAIIHHKGITLINEKSGIWVDEIWYSNAGGFSQGHVFQGAPSWDDEEDEDAATLETAEGILNVDQLLEAADDLEAEEHEPVEEVQGVVSDDSPAESAFARVQAVV